MELATIPQNSSALSTEGSTQNNPSSSSGVGESRSGHKKTNKKRPKKASSDPRMGEENETTENQQSQVHRRAQHGNRQRRKSSESSVEMEEQALKYGASHVIHLFVPVSLCMVVVILTMLTIGYYSEGGEYLPYTPFHEETDDTSILLLQSLANAAILLGVIIVMTVILIILYTYRCYKVIHGWLMLSSVMLLSLFTLSYVEEVFRNYNIPVDFITVGFFIWNWCILGMICIHWKGPLIIQQFYLVSMSAMMALMFIKHLPNWTTWAILAVLSIWDLVAVLCPKGPLRILVETAQQRNEPIFPALIYSSGVLYMYTIFSVLTGEGEPSPNSTEEATTTARATEESEQQQPVTSGQQQPHRIKQRDGSASSTDGLLGNLPDKDVPASSSMINEVESEANKRETRPGQRFAPNRRNQTSTSGDTLITTIGGSSTSASRHPTPNSIRSRTPPRRAHSEQNFPVNEREEDIEERGIKLGLGDFIFYSVLVGKASNNGDWNVTIACYVSILVGLAFTLMLLALFRKALPALPISIFAGIAFFFATNFLITPFAKEVALNQLVF